MKDKLKRSNLAAVTLQYPPKYRKEKEELRNCGKYQPCRIFLKESLAMQIITDCRTTPPINFRTRLGFSQHDPIMTQQQLATAEVMTVFLAEEIRLQYNVLGYRVDTYLSIHKPGIEIDEQGHNNRSIEYER